MTELDRIVWRRRRGVVHRLMSGEVVALPPEADDLLSVTGSAAEVWRLLDRPRSRTALVAEATALLDPGLTSEMVDALDQGLALLVETGLVEADSRP